MIESLRNISVFLLVALLACGCRKQPDPVPPVIIDHGGEVQEGHLSLLFEARANGMPLDFNNTTYSTAGGDSFTVSVFRYYISNIRLTATDSVVYAQPQSYYLVDHGLPAGGRIDLHDVPPGEYKSVSFLVGVDSLRNVSGAQTGALDVSHGMFWGWNTGYIFSKLEGDYISGSSTGSFFYHIGGFTGKDNTLKWITLALPGNVVVGGTEPKVHIAADAAEWFKTPTAISFSNYFSVSTQGTKAKALADNYADMFSVTFIE